MRSCPSSNASVTQDTRQVRRIFTTTERTRMTDRRINYFSSWRMAFEWLSALSPIRQEGSELRSSDSASPSKQWMVIETDGPTYADTFDALPSMVKQQLIIDWLPPATGQPAAKIEDLTPETKAYLMRRHKAQQNRISHTKTGGAD